MVMMLLTMAYTVRPETDFIPSLLLIFLRWVVTVWVDKKSFLMTRIQILDQFGSLTDLVFDNIVINKPFPPSHFNFEPPPGTEVLTQ